MTTSLSVLVQVIWRKHAGDILLKQRLGIVVVAPNCSGYGEALMRVTIIESSFGILAFDTNDKIIEEALFPKNPRRAARILAEIRAGRMADEVAILVNKLKKKGYDIFVFENTPLSKDIQKKLGVNVEISKPSKAGEMLRSCAERFAIETGFAENIEQFNFWNHNLTVEVTKLRVKEAVERRDLVVAQAIQTLVDLDKTTNLLMSRLRELYGLHFPELDRLLEKHETFARLALRLGSRENFTAERLRDEDISKLKADQVAKAAETSMGADLREADFAQIRVLCQNVISLYQLRQTFEDYLEKTMEEVAPNIKTLTGPVLGARLIALAGGLINLAKMPASTIQVLGAEKALFRSLKTGSRPPKHGIIFQHALLHEAKRWQRGKVARALAGKLAIAARTDAFVGRYIGGELQAGLEKRIEEIQKKYVHPPQIAERRPRGTRKRRKGRANKG